MQWSSTTRLAFGTWSCKTLSVFPSCFALTSAFNIGQQETWILIFLAALASGWHWAKRLIGKENYGHRLNQNIFQAQWDWVWLPLLTNIRNASPPTTTSEDQVKFSWCLFRTWLIIILLTLISLSIVISGNFLIKKVHNSLL